MKSISMAMTTKKYTFERKANALSFWCHFKWFKHLSNFHTHFPYVCVFCVAIHRIIYNKFPVFLSYWKKWQIVGIPNDVLCWKYNSDSSCMLLHKNTQINCKNFNYLNNLNAARHCSFDFFSVIKFTEKSMCTMTHPLQYQAKLWSEQDRQPSFRF